MYHGRILSVDKCRFEITLISLLMGMRKKLASDRKEKSISPFVEVVESANSQTEPWAND